MYKNYNKIDSNSSTNGRPKTTNQSTKPKVFGENLPYVQCMYIHTYTHIRI